MARPAYDAQQRHLAYRIWRESNRNVSETLRRLDTEYGWSLARQTLYDWMGEEDWGTRADAQDADDARARDQEETGRRGILASLLRQKDRYDRYFGRLEAEGEMDHQAVGAYTQLIRAIDAFQKLTVDREELAQAKPKPGGLSAEVLAEIEERIGLR